MNEFISVIMLTFNRENHVGKAIESILNQTYKEFELILIDNGSTDQSGLICDKYAKIDKRIKVKHTKKGSIGYGRNEGLAMATGDYITFVDDDDTAYPQMLECLVSLIISGEYDIATCGSHRSTDGLLSNKYVFDGIRLLVGVQCVKELLKRQIYNSSNPTKLFRKSLFQKIRYDEDGKYDDISVMYKLFAEAKSVIASGKPYYCFYRHESNNSLFTTKSDLLSPGQLNEYFDAFKNRTVYLSEKFPNEKSFFEYAEWSYLLSMYKKIEKNNLNRCYKQVEYIRNTLENVFDKCMNSQYISLDEKAILKGMRQ